MRIEALVSSARDLLPLRVRQREEANTQIVHDSIHRREGWTVMYRLEADGVMVGFGSIAIGGPWKDKPTVFEFYLLPGLRVRAFALFEALLAASGARFFEVQTSDVLLTVMLHAYGREVATEKIVFRDAADTDVPSHGALVRGVTPEAEVQAGIERRQGGGEWVLEVDGQPAGTGGILFHYNRPYGDVYMEIREPFRRRGLGAYFVQELKRACYSLGAVPCARCNANNLGSRNTLQRAGFVPSSLILNATVAT